MPTTRRALALYGALVVAAAALIVFGVNSIYGFLNSSSPASGSQRTATVTRGIVQSSVSASGNVGVARSASVGFAESGTLTAVDAGVGTHVKVGQVIAKIDPTDAGNALMSAEANLAQAESTLATAKSGLTATQQASNALSQLQAQSTVTSDEQQLASDETTLATAKAQLTADTRLSCPALSSSGSSASGSSANAASGSSGTSSAAGSAAGGSTAAGSSSAAGSGTGSAGSSGSAGSTGSAGASKSSASSSSGSAGAVGAASSGSSGAGSAGSAGSVGSAGSSGSTGSAGSAGSAGSSGSSGSAGSSATGSSGASGAGASGSSSGGAAGASGAGSPGAGASRNAGIRNGAAVVARAAVAPTVTTGSASEVTSSSATLAGSVTPDGFDTTYVFDYGSSPTSLTSTSQRFDAGSGPGPVPVSVVLSGLHATQSYYFELVATDSMATTTTGNLGLFTTSAAPVVTTPSTTPVATTGQASAIGATSATLAGTVGPQGLDTSYDFVYGTSPSSLSSTSPVVDAGSGSAQVSVSAPVSGLKPNQTYYYALVATNSSGTTTGSTQVFTTATLALATTGQASNIAATGAALAGSVTPGGLDTSYHFIYGTAATALTGATSTLDAGSAATGSVPVSVPLNGLKPGTTYYFALVATNSAGTATGALALFTTATLSVATTGQAASVGSTTATLAGTVSPGGLPTSYWFEYGPSASTLDSKTAKFGAGSGSGTVPVSVPLGGLKPGTTYYFALVATDAAGTATGGLALFTTATLSVATTGQAASVGSTTATLAGTVSPGGLPTSYWFEYGRSASTLDSKTAKFGAGSGSDTVPVSIALSGLKVSTTYFFRLIASNSAGTSDGALALLTTGGPSVSATTGAASAVGSTTATFGGSVDPGGLEATYRFEYGPSASRMDAATSTGDAGSGSGSVSVNTTVNDLKPGTTYVFRLVATNASGTSDGVEESFTTSAGGAPVVLTGSPSGALTTELTLTGSVNPTGSDTRYWFEYGTSGAYGKTTPLTDGGAGTSSATVSATVKGLRANTEYLFRLVAKNSFGTTAGVGVVAKTAETSCTSDAATVSSDAQTVQHAQSTLAQAKESLVQTEATIASSQTPSSTTIALDASTVAQDKATVESDRKALAETTLTAPVSGIVTAVNDSVGETVSAAGTTISGPTASSSSSAAGAGVGAGSGSGSSGASGLATIDSLDQLEIVAGFAEADATKIAVGQPATITFPALTNVEVAGKVVAVSSTSTVVSNVVTYDETIALINPPSEVKEGMTADVSVVDQSANNTLELPTAAITTTGLISTVELLQNGKTTLTRVTTGLVGNSSTQILSGLKLGDVVVEPTVTISAATSSAGSGLTGGGFAGLGGGGAFGGGGGGAFLRGG